MTEVVVTGIGVVCAGGASREEFWQSLCSGVTAIGPVTEVDTRWLGAVLGGEVRDLASLVKDLPFDVSAYNRTTRLALLAAAEALTQAELLEMAAPVDRARIGVVLGTCQGSMPDVAGRGRGAAQSAMHGPVDAVATEFRLDGYRAAVSTACSAGANAIAMARHLLARREADVIVAGGSDALSFFILSGFSSLRAMDPRSCSPYDRSSGLNAGEGAGVLVLERYEHATSRGAAVLAKILGVGQSSDAYHPAAPDPAGRGALAAMHRGLAQAGLTAHDVDYVNGHGTGTSANDRMERRVMQTMFASRRTPPPLSSVKGMIGHTLGAAGAIEAAACVLAIRDGVMPPTANIDPDRDGNDGTIDLLAGRSRHGSVKVALSNNYAFGGSNTSVVVVDADVRSTGPRKPKEPVVVSGVGVVSSLGIGVEQWRARVSTGSCGIAPVRSFDTAGLRCQVGGEVAPLDGLELAAPAVWRRMDALGRQCLASTDQALNDIGWAPDSSDGDDVALLFATSAGSLEAFERFSHSAEGGKDTINPLLFPQTPLNAAAGHVSIARRLRGPTSTVTTGNLSGALALAEAVRLIEFGECDRVLVLAGDILIRSTIIGAEDGNCLLTPSGTVRPFDSRADGSALSASSVALLVEAASTAHRHGRTPYCEVAGFSMGTPSATKPARGSLPWTQTIGAALDDAKMTGRGVDYCVADAPGVPAFDLQEAQAVHDLLGAAVWVGAPKSILGHTMASDLLSGVVVGILAMAHGVVTPTLGLQEPVGPTLRHVRVPITGADVQTVLVNSASVDGSVASFVLRKAPQ